MSDDSNDLSRRKLLGGITTIGAASAVAGAGTFAAFADGAETDAKTISTGTVRLSDDNPTVTGFDPGLLSPGDSFSGSVSVTYVGSLDADVYLGMTLAEGSEELGEQDGTDLTAEEFAAGITVNDGSHIALATEALTEQDSLVDSEGSDLTIYPDSRIHLDGTDVPATLSGLNSVLSTTTDDAPTYKYAPVTDGDELTITLDCTLDETVSQAFQDESLEMRFQFHVVEQGETPAYLAGSA